MSNNSTPNDILRFVHLRAPNVSTELSLPFQLVGFTNFSGKMVGIPRSRRRHVADNWLEEIGNRIVSDLSQNTIYTQIVDAIRFVIEENESPTLRALFIYLANNDLFDGIDPTKSSNLKNQLSDVLLAILYAPGSGLRNHQLGDVESVFRTLLLLEFAIREGITSDDLESEGHYSNLLNLDLQEVLARPLLVPNSLESDYVAKFSVGVADLLVVKQHIKKYEPSEIAHIENIMASETRERNHRRLDRSEEIFTTEIETEVEKETELQTTERFELSEEISRTVKEDQQLSFGLSLSGKYGATTIASNFEFQRSESREETASSSTAYAKDIVERSLERVREKVRRSRTTRILQEVEESNLHSFKNDTGSHIVGIYQFVNKVYEAQVFNYGEREMFDIMIPEPSSYLWHLRDIENSSLTAVDEPTPPDDLPEDLIANLEIKYEGYAVKYRADGIEPPPPEHILVSNNAKSAVDGATEHGTPRSVVDFDLQIPKGYSILSAVIRVVSLTDNAENPPVFGVTIGPKDETWILEGAPLVASDGQKVFHNQKQVHLDFLDGTHRHYELGVENKLPVSILVYESANYSVSVTVQCWRSPEMIQSWRLKSFDRLRMAYESRLLEYQEKLSQFKQELAQKQQADNIERKFGAAPSRKEEIIRGELKKQCIAYITEDFFSGNDDPPVMVEGTGTTPPPPVFRLEEAGERGAFVRFFEQAFEWEHIQYVFYPYFWARNTTWEQRFNEEDPAHQFRQFLQAGWARIVVSVRPGFEEAVHYYLLTGNIWSGKELPPRIGDNLYLSIADEIRRREDQGVLEAIPDGTPWDVIVPTSLIYLREASDLPEWEKIEPRPEDEPKNHWDWRATANSDQ